jgi:hypothetical protein
MCTASGACNQTLIAGTLPLFAIPNQSDTTPVVNGGVYEVNLPVYGLVGHVLSNVYNGGLGIVNTTQQDHKLYDGKVVRIAYESNGKWYVETSGFGNNNTAYWADFNQFLGATIFEETDSSMTKFIQSKM